MSCISYNTGVDAILRKIKQTQANLLHFYERKFSFKKKCMLHLKWVSYAMTPIVGFSNVHSFSTLNRCYYPSLFPALEAARHQRRRGNPRLQGVGDSRCRIHAFSAHEG